MAPNTNTNNEDSFAEPPSNFDPRPSITTETRELSKVSELYDIGNKGFLTPAEQKARGLDHNNEGNLSNEQVVALVERTTDLKKANKMLRRYMVALLLVTVTLGISQIATAIVAARLSKDTSVNSSNGLMTLKDSDKAVVVVSTGQPNVVISVDEAGTKCVKYSDFVDLFTNTVSGTTQNAIVRSTAGIESLSFSASGTHSNETHACLGGSGSLCTTYKPCFPNDEDRRLRETYPFWEDYGYETLQEMCEDFESWCEPEDRRLDSVENRRLHTQAKFLKDTSRKLISSPPELEYELLGPGGQGGGPTYEDLCMAYVNCFDM